TRPEPTRGSTAAGRRDVQRAGRVVVVPAAQARRHERRTRARRGVLLPLRPAVGLRVPGLVRRGRRRARGVPAARGDCRYPARISPCVRSTRIPPVLPVGARGSASPTRDVRRPCTPVAVNYSEATCYGRLSPGDRRALLAQGHERVHHAGDQLCREGDPPMGAFVVLDGYTRLTKSAASGREIMLELRGPGDVLGEMSVVDGRAQSAT